MSSFASLYQLGDCVKKLATGVLTLQSDKLVRQFFFQNGRCYLALSNTKSELPGSFIQKEGKLTAEQFQSYLSEIKKPKANLWEPAVQLSGLSGEALTKIKHAYILQLAAVLYSAAETHAQFQIATLDEPQNGVHGMSLLISALSKISNADLFAICTDLKPNSSVSFDEKLEKKMTPFPLSPEEKGLLTVLKNNTVVSEVFTSSYLGKEKIERLLVAFWLSGLATLENSETTALKKHDLSLTVQDRILAEEVRKKLTSLKTTSYYDWLGIPSDAKTDKITEAATNWIEKLSAPQMDILFYGDERTLPEKLIASFREALKVLSNAAQRAEYDTYLRGGNRGSFVGTSTVGKEQEAISKVRPLLKQGSFKEALSILEEALISLPHSPLLLTEYARVVLKGSGTKSPEYQDRAMTALKKALSIEHPLLESFETLGAWMELLQQKDKAVEAYKRALAIAPHSLSIAEALLRISPDQAGGYGVMAVLKNLDRLSYYELLGIPENASVGDIQKAYRDCTKKYHPDRFFQAEAALKANANQIYKRMVKAYMTLKSANKRAEYDQTISRRNKNATVNIETNAPSTSPTEIMEAPPTDLPQTSQGKKFYQLALAELKQGKKDSAKMNLKLALQLEPNSAIVKKKLQELA